MPTIAIYCYVIHKILEDSPRMILLSYDNDRSRQQNSHKTNSMIAAVIVIIFFTFLLALDHLKQFHVRWSRAEKFLCHDHVTT